MTGPGHYRAAELLLGAAEVPDGFELADDTGRLARAQVHATLALTATIVSSLVAGGFLSQDHDYAWQEVLR